MPEECKLLNSPRHNIMIRIIAVITRNVEKPIKIHTRTENSQTLPHIVSINPTAMTAVPPVSPISMITARNKYASDTNTTQIFGESIAGMMAETSA